MEFEVVVTRTNNNEVVYIFTVCGEHLSDAFRVAIGTLEDESWWSETEFKVMIELTDKPRNMFDMVTLYENLLETEGFFSPVEREAFICNQGYYTALAKCGKEVDEDTIEDYKAALDSLISYRKHQ